MTKHILTFVSVLTCVSAQALDLKTYKDQARWKRVYVIPVDFSDEISLHDTGKGLRLERGQTFRGSEAIVEFPSSLSKQIAAGGAKEACSAPDKMKLKEKYRMQLAAYPLASSWQLKKPDGTFVSAGSLLNQPRIQSVALTLIRTNRVTLSEDPSFNEDPMVSTHGKPFSYLQGVEGKLAAQLTAQKNALAQSGYAALDLTGMPTIACDLALGTLKINVQTTIDFEPGVLETQQFVQFAELRSAYEVLRSNSDAGSGLKGLVFTAVKLGQALERARVQIESLNLERVWTIFSSMFDFQHRSLTVKLKDLDQDALKAISEEIAELIPPSSDTISDRIDVQPANITVGGGL